mgnify:CR=1 FL=1
MLNYNIGAQDAVAYNERDGYLENTFLRYYDNVYAVYSRLRRDYPNVIFESCAGGGGRTDLGMVSNFTHSWVTDWQIHPRAFSITNGMTMALPPECVDRLIGGHPLIFVRLEIFAHPIEGEHTQERRIEHRKRRDIYHGSGDGNTGEHNDRQRQKHA